MAKTAERLQKFSGSLIADVLPAISWTIPTSPAVGKNSVLAGRPPGRILASAENVVVTNVFAGRGLTVVLFVSGQTSTDPSLRGAARTGAVSLVATADFAGVVLRTFFIKKTAGELTKRPAVSLEPERQTAAPKQPGEPLWSARQPCNGEIRTKGNPVHETQAGR